MIGKRWRKLLRILSRCLLENLASILYLVIKLRVWDRYRRWLILVNWLVLRMLRRFSGLLCRDPLSIVLCLRGCQLSYQGVCYCMGAQVLENQRSGRHWLGSSRWNFSVWKVRIYWANISEAVKQQCGIFSRRRWQSVRASSSSMNFNQ